MAKHENDDIVTVYFIVQKDHKSRWIQGYTEDKRLAKMYLAFHKHPNLSLNVVTKPVRELQKIFDECRYDNIEIRNLTIRDPKRRDGSVRVMSAPLTENEMRLVNDETKSFFSGRINYRYLNGVLPYLKDKYQIAIDDILLGSLVDKSITGRGNPLINNIQLDQLAVLLRTFPESFGE